MSLTQGNTRLRFVKAIMHTSFSSPVEVYSFIEMAIFCNQNSTKSVVISCVNTETGDEVTITVENAEYSNKPSFLVFDL